MDREAWWATVRGVANESDMNEQLNNNNVDNSWEFWEQWMRCPHFQLGLKEVAEPLTELAMWEPVNQIPSSVILEVVVKAVMIS